MRRTLFLGLVLVGVGALLAVVPLSRGKDESEAVTRSFTFSSDAEVAVLTVTDIGGLSGKSTIYTLYGDGRLRFERRGRATVVYESVEATLSYQEARDLLAVAIDHGLLDISQQELVAGVKDRFVLTDAGTTVVEIHVTSYTRNGEEQGAVSNTLRLTEPWALRRWNPDNAAIEGMIELSFRLADYQERMASGGSQ